MRFASASWLTSPRVAEAVPPALVISSTKLSPPPQLASRSPGALCSLATPAGRTSETITVTPLAASARAVELPMPIGLPQPVISATRVGWGIFFPFEGIAAGQARILTRHLAVSGQPAIAWRAIYRFFGAEPAFSGGAPADSAG